MLCLLCLRPARSPPRSPSDRLTAVSLGILSSGLMEGSVMSPTASALEEGVMPSFGGFGSPDENRSLPVTSDYYHIWTYVL